jgi:hypothetical protein
MNKLALPEQLNEVVKNSNISDLTKAQRIASNYAPFMEAVNDQMEIIKTLKKGNLDHLQIAKRVKLDLGKICSGVSDQKKIDKDTLLIETRFIDGLFNTVNGAARISQGEAKEIEMYAENLEKERTTKLQLKRVSLLSEWVEDAAERDLHSMEEDIWKVFLATKKQNYLDVIEAEKKLEAERLEKIEAERVEQERIKKENQRLNEEAQAKIKQDKIEADERSKVEAKRIDKENKEREERNKIAEIERKKADDILNKERDEKNKLEAQLKEKREAEEKAIEDAEIAKQSELNKGDSAKVTDLKNDLAALKTKYSFKSAINKKMYLDTCNLIDKVINHIK